MPKLYQGPISDLLDETEVGDLVYVNEPDFPPGNYRVIAITRQKCCKCLVLENGLTILCSKAKPVLPKFVPTDEQKQRGKYAMVFEDVGEDGEWDINSTAHILPLFGRSHFLDKSCWCDPERHESDDANFFFVHRPSH